MLIDIKTIKATAAKEIADEQAKKATAALVKKMRDLAAAQQIVLNIKREIDDLEASLADGSFAG